MTVMVTWSAPARAHPSFQPVAPVARLLLKRPFNGDAMTRQQGLVQQLQAARLATHRFVHRFMTMGPAVQAGRTLSFSPTRFRALSMDVHVGVRKDLFWVSPFMAAGITSVFKWNPGRLALGLEASGCGDGLVALLKGTATDSLTMNIFLGLHW